MTPCMATLPSAEPAFGSVTFAIDIRLPRQPERDENMRPRSSLLGSSAAWDEAADPGLSGSRLQGGPHRTGSAQSAPSGVRIESDSSLEVEPPVLIQIEFAIEPLHLLRSVKRPHPPGIGNWPVNPPTREPIVKRG